MLAKENSDSELFAAAAALCATSGRVLSESIQLSSIECALGAMLCIVDPDAPAPLAAETDGGESSNAEIQSHLCEVLRLAAGRRVQLTHIAIHRRLYARWAGTLLDVGLRNWRGTLTQEQAKALFDSHLVRGPPREAFEALAMALAPSHPLSSPPRRTVARWTLRRPP